MDYLFQKLTDCIKMYDKVVIMTHKNPDLDGMGSSICLYQIVKSLKKEVYVVLPNKNINTSLNKGLNLLNKNNIHINFINEEVNTLIDNNNLLIILDTRNPNLVEKKELLQMKNIIVIDHHQPSSNHIKNTILEYVDSNKSSVVEIMTNYLKYLNMKPNPIIATLMLTGIEIDTHSYRFKTSDKTFTAASFLSKNGANNNLKNEIMKVSKQELIKNNEYIKQSYFIKEGFIICNMQNIKNTIELAILADRLLTIENVEIAFTVGKVNNTTYISARSMGNISADLIMKKLGGGGHVTDAAAQFKNKPINEVIELLTNTVLEG